VLSLSIRPGIHIPGMYFKMSKQFLVDGFVGRYPYSGYANMPYINEKGIVTTSTLVRLHGEPFSILQSFQATIFKRTYSALRRMGYEFSLERMDIVAAAAAYYTCTLDSYRFSRLVAIIVSNGRFSHVMSGFLSRINADTRFLHRRLQDQFLSFRSVRIRARRQNWSDYHLPKNLYSMDGGSSKIGLADAAYQAYARITTCSMPVGKEVSSKDLRSMDENSP